MSEAHLSWPVSMSAFCSELFRSCHRSALAISRLCSVALTLSTVSVR
jgi:hypothetical protein